MEVEHEKQEQLHDDYKEEKSKRSGGEQPPKPQNKIRVVCLTNLTRLVYQKVNPVADALNVDLS